MNTQETNPRDPQANGARNADMPDFELEEISADLSDVSPLDIPVLVIFVTLFVIVALQFFTRYVLNDSLGWTEEIARYFLIMMGFVGAIMCVRKDSHIRLEFLYRYLPDASIKPLLIAVAFIGFGFWGYAGWLGIELAQRTNANMASVQIPKSTIYYVVAAGCFVMAAYALRHCAIKYRQSSADILRETRTPQVEDI